MLTHRINRLLRVVILSCMLLVWVGWVAQVVVEPPGLRGGQRGLQLIQAPIAAGVDVVCVQQEMQTVDRCLRYTHAYIHTYCTQIKKIHTYINTYVYIYTNT